ncbi:vitamin K epoxide reductase family protein [Spirillospora sp. CA-294931]|uniref:vitamin K epoxide reductase family protein n=1 Tax=Spirillospora sp. CA-294931 TaxID=3240042 RepID=UPI003D8D4BFB
MAQRVETRDDGAAKTPPRPLWFLLTAWVLTLAGLGISIYMTISHFDKDSLVCSSGKTLDCHAVTSSKYSELLGIPVPILGLAFFVGFAVLVSPQALRSELPLLRWGRLASVSVGVLFVAYLMSAEFVLGKICTWCTAVHGITILLFVLVLFDEFRRIGQID